MTQQPCAAQMLPVIWSFSRFPLLESHCSNFLSTGSEDTLDDVRHPSKRWDSQECPFNLRGKEIPMACLMALAGALRAMASRR